MLKSMKKDNPWPRRLQSIFAALVMAVIAVAGYLIGRDNPVPVWIERFLMPALAWLGLVLIVIVVVDWLRKRLR